MILSVCIDSERIQIPTLFDLCFFFYFSSLRKLNCSTVKKQEAAFGFLDHGVIKRKKITTRC